MYDTGPYRHSYPQPNTDSNCHTCAHTDPNADRNSDANTASHSHRHPYTDPNAPTHGHAYTNSESEPPGGYQRGSEFTQPHWRKSFRLAETCRDLLRALVEVQYRDGRDR